MVVEAFDREQKRKLATGTLLTVDNQIDPTTGTVRLKAVFPNDDSALVGEDLADPRAHAPDPSGDQDDAPGQVEVHCEFCGRGYRFDPVDARALFAAAPHTTAPSRH